MYFLTLVITPNTLCMFPQLGAFFFPKMHDVFQYERALIKILSN